LRSKPIGFAGRIMSANQSHTSDGHGILLYTGEMVLLYAKHVDVSFKTAPEPFFKGKHRGNVYLTSHRIIFLGTDNGSLKSLAMPFTCLNNINLEQPIFGANYIDGTLAAQPGGNFDGEIGWKLTFPKGGCIDFGKALRQAVMIVHSNRPANAPPPYVPPAGSYYSPPPDYYAAPPPANLNGFQAPTHVFPDRPEEGTLFVYDQPPPYCGIPMNTPAQSGGPIYPTLPPQNGQQQQPYPPPMYPATSAGPPYPGGDGRPTASAPPPPPSYDDSMKLPDKPKVE